MNAGDPIGAIRRHASALAAWPRPRLRPTLEHAVYAVEKRLDALARIMGDHPIELVWGRRSPLTVLRETRVQHSWRVSPTVVVQVARAAGAHATDRPSSERPSPAAAPPLPAMLLATVERRLETRVVERAVAALAGSAKAAQQEAIPRSIAERAAPPLPAATPMPLATARVPSAPMVLARAPGAPGTRLPAEVSHARTAEEPISPRAAARSPQRAPEIAIDRITAEVVRALDARVIAWRERTGRT